MKTKFFPQSMPYALFSMPLSLLLPYALCLMPYTAHCAGIRVGNLSRSNAQGYQQVNEMRYASSAEVQSAQSATTATVATATTTDNGTGALTQTAVAVEDLPVRVANASLAAKIASGDRSAGVDIPQLQRCARVYPDGEFAWDKPTAGRGAGGATTCVSVIEMRAIGAGQNGADAVLLRANLAAGDAIKCNISEFPDATLLPAAGTIEFPADNEPTIDDVVKVMNQEQKQNAGIKIAAGAIIGGLAGNIAGKNEPGSDSLLGGGKHKTESTVVGALSGAALMTGNAYAGKVGGDIILSTGVNAAAGGVMGNIMASGNSVMRIEDCTVDGKETTCLWGYVEKTEDIQGTAYVSINDITDFKVCSGSDGMSDCQYVDLSPTSVVVPGYADKKTESTKQPYQLSDIMEHRFGFVESAYKYTYNGNKMEQGQTGDKVYVKLDGTPKKVSNRTPAMIVDVDDKSFGWTKSDWQKLKSNDLQGKTIVGRVGAGKATALTETVTIDNFTPMYLDAEDGGIIDLSNKARKKSTLTGAGVGGAMGAFTGYQGAQQDIDERWVTAVREYKDSLQKVYCVTGNRFLSYYNDMVIIPSMDE